MKTIKNKLMTSLVSMVIIIPIIMIIIFNIFINTYFEINSRRELKRGIFKTQQLIKENIKNKLYDNFEGVATMIRSLQFVNNVQILVFDNNLNTIYPESDKVYFDSEVIDEIKKNLKIDPGNKVKTIRGREQKYYVATYSVNDRSIANSSYLVFISKGSNIKLYIREINIILVITMLIGVIVNIYISNSLSKSITKPIKRLSKVAKEIGYGKFEAVETVEAYNSTVEIHNLYNSINLMAKRLKENDETKKKFIQNASHEMRTPLMSIQGYAEGIENAIFEDNSAAAKIIKEESIRLNGIVSGLINLSIIENKLYDTLYTVDIVKIIKQYILNIHGYALCCEKELEINCMEEKIIVKGEENLLSQIFVNIISNSVKYASSKVIIEINIKEEYALVIITDDGKGINEEDLPHIFERFYKGKYGNFGLGLSIAKAATEALNGTIEVANKDGARFTVKIPLA